MVLLGVILGVMAVIQLLAIVYAKRLRSRGNSDVERRHRDTAATSTVLCVVLILLLWPSPWYKEPPLNGFYTVVAQNLKPRDKQGHGWLAPQVYQDKSDLQMAQYMLSTVHKTLIGAILASLLGVAAGALTTVWAKMSPPRPAYRPPSGPFQSRGY